MVYLLLSSIITFSAMSAELPKFLAKQSVDSLRYVSNDGKAIYYQTKLGILNMTKNYKNEKILEIPGDTQFSVSNSVEGKILIEADPTYHSQLTVNKNNQIYLANVGEPKAKKMAEGKNARLELDGNWMSFYSPMDKSIVFQNLIIEDQIFRIKLKNTKNPYFQPTYLMLTDKDVYFTDINSDGVSAILHYSKIDKKYNVVYKAKFPGSMIEFCKIKNQLIAFERGLFNTKNGSQMFIIPLFQNKNYQKKELIYTSDLNDIGSLTCEDDVLYFVKTIEYDEYLNDKNSEIAKLKLTDKKIEIISDFKDVTSITRLGNRVLARYKQDFYLIEGKNDAKNDSIGTN